MERAILATVLLGAIACGRPHVNVATRSPNPNGCYVMFFDKPGFGGHSDLLNGPGTWPVLKQVHETNYPDWEKRIRSLRTGETARVTAYVRSEFRGDSEAFSPESSHRDLGPNLSGKIESLQIACQQAGSLSVEKR